MVEYSKKNLELNNISVSPDADSNQFSNPLSVSSANSQVALSQYTQVRPKPKYDDDTAGIVEVVKILNNLAPIRMPVYNFNINEINGDAYYKPDGTLLLIREYDNDVIRDYYAVPLPDDDNFSVARILEHDRNTGRLRTKIEPITRKGSRLNTNITIFDSKVSNRYTLIQLSDDGIVNNISEFLDNGKSFKTLFRNIQNFKPARYLEGKDSKQNGFEMLDCLFDANGKLVKLKRFTNKKEVSIDYTDDKKNITVKNK